MPLLIEVDGRRFDVHVFGAGQAVATAPAKEKSNTHKRAGKGAKAATSERDVLSPGQGTILRVAVEVGQSIAIGDLICVLESMKMENEVVSQRDGVIAALGVTAGQSVSRGQLLASIDDQ
jgi:acetyl-CoA/propionyl-CoA carboxylase biotin carboxyl carrier protein